MKKFDGYFIPKRNVIHESAVFNSRTQAQDESVEIFLRSLQEYAEYCSFNNKSEEIRDKLVIGFPNNVLSKKLELTENSDLNKDCEIARNLEVTN